MSIESQEDLLGLMKIGRIVGLTLQHMSSMLRPGMTTKELDDIGRAFLAKHGARSAPELVYQFPGATCISINDEAAHGIPGDRVVQPGDLVNIDVSAELNGYFADTGASVPVPPISPLKQKLCDSAKAALYRAIDAVRAGQPMNVVGRAVEVEARKSGFTIIQDLCGHGVGRSIHEAPRNVLNFYDARAKQKLTEGMVITIEPFLSNGARRSRQSSDGWTLKTAGSKLVAQYEHTMIITNDHPILVTAV